MARKNVLTLQTKKTSIQCIRKSRSLLLLLPLAAGCAGKLDKTQPRGLDDATENNDPYELTNRKAYRVSDVLDEAVLRPVATGYRNVTPSDFREHMHDLLTNIGSAAQLTNDVLQGKPRRAGNTFMRLVINTTLGLGGAFDVASGWGYPDQSNDFGLTLAVWGVPSGPYLFLPMLGPSDLRDGLAYGVDPLFNPLTWVSFGGSATFGYASFGVRAVDSRVRVMGETDSIQKTALDPYATFRSLYQQHREAEIIDAQHDLVATTPAWYASKKSAVAATYVPPNTAPKILPPVAIGP